MPLLTRKIKRQINSIKNTKKITKAMELVSASKMRKAVNAVSKTKPFAKLAWSIITNLSAKTHEKKHRLLKTNNEIKRICVIFLSSNRGLCGNYNQQIIKKVLSWTNTSIQQQDKLQLDFITLGKKGASALVRSGQKIIADFEKIDFVGNSSIISPITKKIIDDYHQNKYDQIFIAYTDFINSLKQKPIIRQLLPIPKESDITLDDHEQNNNLKQTNHQKSNHLYQYLYEPNATQVLEEFLPNLIEIQIYQALLEANASEHSARMMAMKNASEAANDLIFDLTLSYNKSRQSGITQELTEISVSKAALEN